MNINDIERMIALAALNSEQVIQILDAIHRPDDEEYFSKLANELGWERPLLQGVVENSTNPYILRGMSYGGNVSRAIIRRHE